MEYLLVAGGLALLLGGGEILVRGAVGVAARLGLSPMLIGLTLVGFGTSAPELTASIDAALRGSPGIAVGNVVGSNIANILLILGASALIAPLATNRESFRRDGPVLLAVSALMVAVALAGGLGPWGGLALVALLGAYLAASYVLDRRANGSRNLHEAEAAEVMPAHPHLWRGLALSVGGIAAVVLGADWLVEGAIVIARDAGLSEAVIGLTLVAVGTSLPELATSVMAAVRRHGDVALGNVVGSNIFNILGILGITAMVEPLAVPPEIARFDVWVMLAAAIALLAYAATGWRLRRWEAALFLAAYGVYLGTQFSPPLRAALGLA